MNSSTLKNKKGIIGIVVIIVILLGGYLGYNYVNKPAPVAKQDFIYVKAINTSEDSRDNINNYPGVVKGRYETNLSFQVGGKIISKEVQMGDHVVAGQVLMTIDDKDIRDSLSGANSQVNAAKSQLDLASTTLKRYEQLYSQNAVSAQTLDQMRANYRAALANYQAAQSQANKGNNALGYTKLRATASGVISQVMGEVGQVVGAGQPVAVFVQDGTYEIEISVPENRLANIKVGAPAKVTFWALNKLEVEGKIREVAPMADPATRTYKVKIALNHMPEQVKLGMTANVVLDGAPIQGVVLPLSAIYQTGDNPTVWIIKTDEKGNKFVVSQQVKVKALDDNKVEVQGLPKGAVVVVAGVDKLSQNQKVKLMDGDNS